MPTRDILFIVEGKKTEPLLVDSFNKHLSLGTKTNIFVYGTTIYDLYDKLSEDDYLNIALFLKSIAKNKRDREMLSKSFQGIYLIFDFDPHHELFCIEKIKKMQKYFNESIDRGLLLINYPMIEAFKHLKTIPDFEFIDRTISKENVLKYKELVGRESNYTNHTKYNRYIIILIILHHIIKISYIVNNEKKLPSLNELEELIKSETLIDKQYERYLNDNLSVVACFFFYVLEMKGAHFYTEFDIPVKELLCNT